ncbi:hypothetical protein LTS18_008444 [Coniosporium uncinatum]|uniref:Uncharacterized protein n=1 Tax=Coniosporium uncinatum TaxID=93489 RepID=A0ACC3DYQ3_9PEZI|nr:hypothetical protein LTS18_008444 [Coniosporium uncinatum]
MAQSRESQPMDPGDFAHQDGASRSKRKRTIVSYRETIDEEEDNDDNLEDSPSDFEAPDQKKKNKRVKPLKSPPTKAPLQGSKRNSNTFPFLSLPAELRNTIYELALTDPSQLHHLVSTSKKYRRTVRRDALCSADERWQNLYGSNRFRASYNHPLSSQPGATDDRKTLATLSPALLVANRQIYREAKGFLYAGPIVVEDTTALHAWLAGLGRETRGLLEELTVARRGQSRSHKAMNHPALTLLAEGATRLKVLRFECRVGDGVTAERVVQQVHRDGLAWLEAVGKEKGRRDAGVEVLRLSEENWAGGPYGRWFGKKPSGEEIEREVRKFGRELRRLLGAA